MRIEKKNLYFRTVKTLQRAGYTTTEQVMAATDDELLSVRNLGVKMLQEIRAVIWE